MDGTSRLADDSGMSLIELIIAFAISLAIAAALLATLSSGTQAESAVLAKHDALLELRGAIARASTDIRQATDVNRTSTPSRLDIQTFAGGAPTRMIFELSGSSFVRTVCSDADFDFSAPCAGAGAELVRDVGSAQPFCYDPPNCLSSAPSDAMRLVRIKIERAPAAVTSEPLSLGADVQLRNRW